MLKNSLSIATLAVLSSQAIASGYKVNEQAASHSGRAFAGSAAVANDASVVFFNPAGMSRLDRSQASFGFGFISAEGEFRNGERIDPAGISSNTPLSLQTPFGESDVYNDGGNFLGDTIIPFGYYVHKLNEKAAIGFGLFAPFGTSTDYATGSLASGFADETQLSAIEFQPSFSYQITDTLSFGAGLDIVYAEGLLSKELDLVPLAAAYQVYGAQVAGGVDEARRINPEAYRGFENKIEIAGDDWAYGFNFGLMWDISESTTVGFAYRSEIDLELEGESEFSTSDGVVAFLDPDREGPVPAGIYPVDGASGRVEMQNSYVPLTGPHTATFSIAHQFNEKLQLLAGATWADWSSFKYFDIIATEDGIIDDLSGLGDNYIGHIVEKWHDTVSYAIGAEYQLNPQWIVRSGYAFDESPVKDEYRTARVPDNDRQWLTLGATFTLNRHWSFDGSLGYLFMDDSPLDEVNKDLNDAPIGRDRLTGEYSIDAFVMSLQANYRW